MNPAMFDGSSWMNPAMLDGFSGRILSRLVVSVVQILPSRPGGSHWANPVGQSTLDETNGFHRRVCHWHFCECPLGKSTWATATLRLRGAQCARSPVQYATMPRLLGAQSAAKPRSQIAQAISALGSKLAICCGSQPRNAKAASAPDIKAPSPFQLPESKARKPKTISPNHQGKAQSSLAFSHRHSEGWQPRFRWGHIQQLPLHQAPEAYRQTPTQAPSRE